MRLLSLVLPDEAEFDGTYDKRDEQFIFRLNGRGEPFPALSDGYKAFIGWIADLLSHMHECCPRHMALVDMPGLVLVDEIDLHLHPSWQRIVVPKLAKAFPNLQFVFTSHSPLVAGTLSRESVFVTETDSDGLATVAQIEESVHGRSAEQLLLSPYFGLNTTRSPDSEDATKRMFRRAAKGEVKAALEVLDHLAGGFEDLPKRGGRAPVVRQGRRGRTGSRRLSAKRRVARK